MFAVTGITGQVGAVVGAKLLDRGLPVRAVMRNAEKAGSWRERGAEIAIAEMTDAAALADAFAGAEAVFLLIPPAFDPAPGFPQAKLIIEALKTALVKAAPKKVVCLSTIGAQAKEENLLTQLGLVEQALSELPMPVAFLRAGWFMENSVWDIAPARDGVMPSFLQPLDKPVPMVGVRDVGAVAAEMLQEDWTGKRIVELEGPYRITPLQMAEAFSAVLGRPVHAEKVERDVWEALFRSSQGMQNPGPRMRMLDGFNEGWIEFEGGEAGSRKGEIKFETAIRALVERS